MIIFKKEQDIQRYIADSGYSPQEVGFIPTMGALHAGHLSLVRLSKKQHPLSVCSIFVNPTQFNDPKDFEKYPIAIEEDIRKLTEAGCDILFFPSVEEIYPHGTDNAPVFNFGSLENLFEGEKRPGHFKGVGQVVNRLLDIIRPGTLYLGQKDYQQCMIIRKLLEQPRKAGDIRIVIGPTIREEDGLAMSSRNTRLTEAQRTVAGLLYQCLVSIQAKFPDARFPIVQKECLDLLTKKNIEPEYVALADADTLEPLAEYDPEKSMIALIAARVGEVRLIDNLLLNPSQNGQPREAETLN